MTDNTQPEALRLAEILDRARIRDIFMAHGFTVKDGQTDLKQYVYDAADALLRAARAPADSVGWDADRIVKWSDRIQRAHPKSEPEFWPDALCVKYMADEISDLRAALAPADSVPAADWTQPTTVAQRLADAVQLLCGGKRPPDAMVHGWLDHSSEELQSFAASHGPSWAQGIGLIDAAMVMVDQPTEITTIDHQQRDHEHRAALAKEVKDHQIAALVNGLRDIAVQYHGTQQLRERIAQVVVPALRAADSVLEDAARWRELREQHESDEALCCVFAPNDMRECLVPVGSLPGELDAFIDAAIDAAMNKGASHDR